MRLLGILLVILVAAGIAGGGVWLQNSRAAQAASRSEAELQAPEIKECKRRLATFYKAFNQYRSDHKGAIPPSFESLVPRYIKPDDMICPTAERWRRNRKGLEQGRITVNKRVYPVTYGFRWLRAGGMRPGGHGDGKAPLIICASHREAMYIASHGGKRIADVTSSDAEGDGPILVVRENGEVGSLLPGED